VSDRKSVSEKSYEGRSCVSRLHRKRLDAILRELNGIPRPEKGVIADFGCSTGLICQKMREQVFGDDSWTIMGLDFYQPNLDGAANRRIPGSDFQLFDLNEIDSRFSGRFDLITCIETLEHTADFRTAFENLYLSARVGGTIVVTVPNETGLIGLVKFLARKVVRRKAYGDFFEGQSELKYVMCLLLNRPIDGFRGECKKGWGPHLGFDWKVLDSFITKSYVESGRCRIVKRSKLVMGTTLLYVLKKVR
jgi:SAM-dependent methyltransferase